LTAEKAAFLELIDLRIKECLLEKFESYFPDKPGSTKRHATTERATSTTSTSRFAKTSSKEKYNPFISLSVSIKSPPEFAVCKWNEKKRHVVPYVDFTWKIFMKSTLWFSKFDAPEPRVLEFGTGL